MLVICSNCKARLQLDEGKAPAHAFKVRCPKCHSGIEVKSSSTAEGEGLGTMSLPAEMSPPAPHIWPLERQPVAAPFKGTDTETTSTAESSAVMAGDFVKLLSELLRQKDNGISKTGAIRRPAWDRRKALICTEESYRNAIASGLSVQDYEIFVAESTAEALGRMREDRIEVLILDANFDQAEQGFAFVTRELKLMRPAERRRMFLVYLTSSARTMDLHAAFLHNANLVVNPSDVERLPEALEVSLRHYNELYREVNRVLELPPL